MSIERGKLLACDRCGFTVFLKSTGESQTDGGRTTYETYEDPKTYGPWMTSLGFVDLCPDCARQFQSFINKFLPNVNVPRSWTEAITIKKEGE